MTGTKTQLQIRFVPFRPDLTDIVLDDGVSPVITFFPDFLQDPHGAVWMMFERPRDIVFIRVELLGLSPGSLGWNPFVSIHL